MDDLPDIGDLTPEQILKVLCENEARSVLAKAKFELAKAEIVAAALRLMAFLLVLDDGEVVWKRPPLECVLAESFIDDDQDWAINVECNLRANLRAIGHDLTDALQEHHAALMDEDRGRLTVTVHRHAVDACFAIISVDEEERGRFGTYAFVPGPDLVAFIERQVKCG